MKIDLKILDIYIKDGWLIKQDHKYLPLSIYNYSLSTQFNNHWDEITTICRGLVIDNETGDIIARCLPKFHNYEEVVKNVPWSTSPSIYIQEKMDGSYFQLFNYKGQWLSSSRGAFFSDMSINGMELVKSNYNLNKFDPKLNYIGEVIYPENRICVDYGSLKTVRFFAITQQDSELSPKDVEYQFNKCDVIDYSIFTEYGISSHDLYKILKLKNIQNKEGYVLRFQPSNFRVKIKFEDYINLHSIMTNISSYDIWRNLMEYNKIPLELLNNIPDELFNWIKLQESNLRNEYSYIYNKYKIKFSEIYNYQNRKEFVDIVSKINNEKNNSILFQLYTIQTLSQELGKKTNLISLCTILEKIKMSQKNIYDYIWKIIKPKYEKPKSI